jgi:hypothetical protein
MLVGLCLLFLVPLLLFHFSSHFCRGELVDLEKANADIHLKFNINCDDDELGADRQGLLDFELTSGEMPSDGYAALSASNGSGIEPKLKV